MHESPTADGGGQSSLSVSPCEWLLLPARLPGRRPGLVLAAGAAFGVHVWAQETHTFLSTELVTGAGAATARPRSQVRGSLFPWQWLLLRGRKVLGGRALGAPSCPPCLRGKGAQVGKSELCALQPLALQRHRCSSASLPASHSLFNHILLVTPCKPGNDFIFNDSCTHFSVANVRREFTVAPFWYLCTFFPCNRRIDEGVFGSITFPFWNLLNAAHKSVGGIMGPWLMWRGPEGYIVSEDVSRGSGGLVF